MTINEINKSAQELIGFESMGFYEYTARDRNYLMLKHGGEMTYLVGYEFFPKEGKRELTFNGYPHENITVKRVNEIMIDALPPDFFQYPFGAKPSVYGVLLRQSNEKYLKKTDFINANRPGYIIENGVFDEANFLKSCALWKECIERFALPFFEQFTSLQQINDEIIDKIPQMEVGSRIPGKMSMKKLVIMFLCNNKGYEEYKQWYLNIVKKSIDRGDPEGQKDYKHVNLMIDYLESGKYLKLEKENPEQAEASPSPIKLSEAVVPLAENKELAEQFVLQKDVLSRLGILLNDAFTLDDLRRDANWKSWGMETKEGNDLLYYLLLLFGTTLYNQHTSQDEPVSSGVYYFNAEWDGFVDYGVIITRLNLLTGNVLPFTEVVGCFDDELTGATFRYKDQFYQWEFKYDNDWTDMRVFDYFLELTHAELSKTFYILPEGQGGLIFYFTKEEKMAFENAFSGKRLARLKGISEM